MRKKLDCDKYGLRIISKSHQAAIMFEAGATHKEIKDKLGRSFYDLLRKLRSKGFKFYENGNLKRQGISISKNGYVIIRINKKPKGEHVLIAEKALGKSLPKGSHVHHVDGNPSNNDPKNLVVCPNSGYHKLLELRTRALEICGNANYRKCPFCKKYDDPENMWLNGGTYRHGDCHIEYNKLRKRKKQ